MRRPSGIMTSNLGSAPDELSDENECDYQKLNATCEVGCLSCVFDEALPSRKGSGLRRDQSSLKII